jgi:hypothetical protein
MLSLCCSFPPFFIVFFVAGIFGFKGSSCGNCFPLAPALSLMLDVFFSVFVLLVIAEWTSSSSIVCTDHRFLVGVVITLASRICSEFSGVELFVSDGSDSALEKGFDYVLEF